jgi:hypothetical protein
VVDVPARASPADHCVGSSGGMRVATGAGTLVQAVNQTATATAMATGQRLGRIGRGTDLGVMGSAERGCGAPVSLCAAAFLICRPSVKLR